MFTTTMRFDRRAGATACALTLAWFMAHDAAMAHHPSGTTSRGGSGGIVTQNAETLSAGERVISVTHEYIELNRLDDDTLIDAASQERDVHSLGKIQSGTVGIFYGLTNYITIGAAIPWVSRSEIFEGEEHDDDFEVEKLGTAEGIGDLTLSTQVRLFQNPDTGQTIALIGGVKLPTGSTGDKDLEGNSFEAEFQPGSGSVDLQLGGAYRQPVGPLTFDSSVLYIFVQEGTQDVDLGDRFLYNAALSFRVLGEAPVHHHSAAASDHPHGPTLDLVVELNGEWSDKEVDSGIVDPDTGGNTLYLSPGIRLGSDGMAGFVSVGIPVSNDFNGTQSQPDWRIMSGVSLALP